MADEFDKASETEMLFNQLSLEAQQEASKQKLTYREGEDPYECDECGVIIPTSRRQLTGEVLCVDCKQWDDKVKKMKRIRGEE